MAEPELAFESEPESDPERVDLSVLEVAPEPAELVLVEAAQIVDVRCPGVRAAEQNPGGWARAEWAVGSVAGVGLGFEAEPASEVVPGMAAEPEAVLETEPEAEQAIHEQVEA